MKQCIFRHTVCFALCTVLAVALLLLGACLPQAPIDANVKSSAEGMYAEGSYPTMADKSFASMLDYTTDALILAESKATHIAQWDSIFTNPLYESGEGTKVEYLYRYTQEENPQPTGWYVQYWMGFRPVMRLLLSFLDYYQILRYVAFSFFVLLALVICSVAKHTGTRSAFLFALSIILVRPHVIAVSLQFSCCFFLALIAMLLVPRLHRKPRLQTLFFMMLGIATQYFDFYTTPILTFGLPMTYLYLLRHREGKPLGAKIILRDALCWMAGYVGMWLAKLLLTSLLTGADGIGTGMASFMGRIGITKTSGLEAYYNPLTALRTVAASLYSDREGKWILFGAAALLAVLAAAKFLKDHHTPRQLLTHKNLLLIAALPVIWFMVAAQPTANHHWFQYRGIAVSFWAGLLWLQLTLQKQPDLPASET